LGYGLNKSINLVARFLDMKAETNKVLKQRQFTQ